MTVECTSCGHLVDVPALPARCPVCRNAISGYVPPLAFSPQSGHRIVKPARESLETLPEWNEAAEANYQYQQRRSSHDFTWWKLGGAIAGCLLIVFALVAYLAMRSGSSNQTVQTTPAVPPPTSGNRPSAPAAPGGPPAVAAPSYVAPAPPVAPPPPTAAAPVATTPPPARAVTPPQPAAPTRPARLIPVRAPPPEGAVTDADVNAAIGRGITYLLHAFEHGALSGKKEPLESSDGRLEGTHALCALALLYAGQATFDERVNLSTPLMTSVMDRLKKLRMDQRYSTYARGLRASALAVNARPVDRSALQADLDWLLKAAHNGAYGYGMPPEPRPEQIGWDNSNTQYGNLGVWAAADAGLLVPGTYWRDVEKHWTDAQAADGGWGYNGGAQQGTLAMTAAGINMLFVARDRLNAERGAVGSDKDPFPPSLQRGLDWLASGDRSVNITSWSGYTLYGLERAGLASGFKYFGEHDWYRELAARVVKEQRPDNSWDGSGDTNEVIDTAFSVLFLSRGRHPILMNKLRFDGAWANRPRDLVRLARFVFDSIERPVNWQVVSVRDAWTGWTDAPIVYLASHEAVPLGEEEAGKIKQYVEAGGLLFTQADADSQAFNDWVEQLAAQLFPQYPMEDLPESHPIFSALYNPRTKPPLRGVSNGSRLLIVHSPTDLSGVWQNRLPQLTTAKPAYEMGTNLFVYATGKHPLRHRLDPFHLDEPPLPPIATVTLARLKYDGPWDPEPAAWGRFRRWMGWETGIELKPEPIDLGTLEAGAAPLAHVTATAPWSPGDEQLKRLREYVKAGGVLLVDPVGGRPEVGEALREGVLDKAFPGATWKELAAEHPIRAGQAAGTEELPKQSLRVSAVEHYDNRGPEMEILEHGKGVVIFSRLDLTSGLLGTTTGGILGYDPAYAQAFAKNLVLWAANERDTPNAWTGPGTRPAK